MKAIMYGAGNIGRGFVGALLSQAGYRVSFVDVMEPVVRALQENERYPVRYVSTPLSILPYMFQLLLYDIC